jgi:hypothetical protein
MILVSCTYSYKVIVTSVKDNLFLKLCECTSSSVVLLLNHFILFCIFVNEIFPLAITNSGTIFLIPREK